MVVVALSLILITGFCCPSTCQTFHRRKNYEYFYGDVVPSYTDAVAKCKESGGDILSIKTEQLNKFIVQVLTSANIVEAPFAFYIGLKRHAPENVDTSFKWERDSSLLSNTYQGWAASFPSSKNADCVLMGSTTISDAAFSWRDAACFTEARYLCDRLAENVRLLSDGFYHRFGSQEYYFGEPANNFALAERDCAIRSGTLAVLLEEAAYDYVKQEMTHLSLHEEPFYFYIGLRRNSEVNNNNAFDWVGGISLGTGFVTWASGQPDSSDAGCVVMGNGTNGAITEYDWSDITCGTIARYICQREYTNSSEGINFITYGSLQYYFGPPVTNYDDAEIRCQKFSGSLVTIHTRDILMFLINETAKIKINAFPFSYFIGLKRINNFNNDSGFAWVDGTLLTSSQNASNWMDNEPDLSQHTCVIMGWIYSENEFFRWYDVPCSSISRFICEREIPDERLIKTILKLIEQIFVLPIGYLVALGVGLLLSLAIVTLIMQLLHLGKIRLEVYESEDRNKQQAAELEAPVLGVGVAESKYFEPIAKVQ